MKTFNRPINCRFTQNLVAAAFVLVAVAAVSNWVIAQSDPPVNAAADASAKAKKKAVQRKKLRPISGVINATSIQRTSVQSGVHAGSASGSFGAKSASSSNTGNNPASFIGADKATPLTGAGVRPGSKDKEGAGGSSGSGSGGGGGSMSSASNPTTTTATTTSETTTPTTASATTTLASAPPTTTICPYTFNGGTLTPDTVAPGGKFKMTCNYGITGVAGVSPEAYVSREPSGLAAIQFTGWTGNVANFDCTATSVAGRYRMGCGTYTGSQSDLSAACSNPVGTLTVTTSAASALPLTPTGAAAEQLPYNSDTHYYGKVGDNALDVSIPPKSIKYYAMVLQQDISPLSVVLQANNPGSLCPQGCAQVGVYVSDKAYPTPDYVANHLCPDPIASWPSFIVTQGSPYDKDTSTWIGCGSTSDEAPWTGAVAKVNKSFSAGTIIYVALFNIDVYKTANDKIDYTTWTFP